ncbi:MAG: lysoplasmalogenase, partial [bacterium]|nr:lysoplasmalogenase [bacterium]
MINYILGFLLFLAVAANVYGSINDKKIFIYIAKPLLMPLVISIYLYNANSINWLLLIGLVLGWIGDISLIKTKGIRFIIGLTSFLAEHILYIFLFLGRVDYLKNIPPYFYLFILVYLIFVIPLYIYLKNSLGKMKIPVLIYLIVIVFMSFSSLTYVTVSTGYDFWFPFTGSILFMISDSILAINTFIKEGKFYYSAIIITYVLAQLFIVLGFLPL